MIGRARVAILLLLMASFGVGVYGYLGTLKSRPTVTKTALKPSVTKPRFVLPGTMFLAQGGSLYRLQGGQFSLIASGSWTQPTLTPDHSHLVAVSRGGNVSDLFLLDLDGHVIRQLTHNANRTVYYNHWSFYPRVSPDGKTLFYSWDPKDFNNSYRVDLAVFAMPLNGTQSQAREITYPYYYTGGDIQPIPLASGAVLYAKYDVDELDHVYSRLWLTTRAGTVGRALTTQEADCSQPSLSPDGTMLAMICTGGQQVGRLVVASFDGVNVGPLRTLVDGQLCAAPVWSPDGSGLAYLAPSGPAGHFQLFYLALPRPAPSPVASASIKPSASASINPSGSASSKPAISPTPAPTPTPPVPQQVSTDLDFDTTASPAWY